MGATVAGGCEQLVGVGPAEAAEGFAVEVQPAGDHADRPAFLQQAVDVFVAVVGAFGDLGAGRFRGRQQHRAASGVWVTVSFSACLRRQSRCW